MVMARWAVEPIKIKSDGKQHVNEERRPPEGRAWALDLLRLVDSHAIWHDDDLLLST